MTPPPLAPPARAGSVGAPARRAGVAGIAAARPPAAAGARLRRARRRRRRRPGAARRDGAGVRRLVGVDARAADGVRLLRRRDRARARRRARPRLGLSRPAARRPGRGDAAVRTSRGRDLALSRRQHGAARRHARRAAPAARPLRADAGDRRRVSRGRQRAVGVRPRAGRGRSVVARLPRADHRRRAAGAVALPAAIAGGAPCLCAAAARDRRRPGRGPHALGPAFVRRRPARPGRVAAQAGHRAPHRARPRPDPIHRDLSSERLRLARRRRGAVARRCGGRAGIERARRGAARDHARLRLLDGVRPRRHHPAGGHEIRRALPPDVLRAARVAAGVAARAPRRRCRGPDRLDARRPACPTAAAAAFFPPRAPGAGGGGPRQAEPDRFLRVP